jgi:hypothetical protein
MKKIIVSIIVIGWLLTAMPTIMGLEETVNGELSDAGESFSIQSETDISYNEETMKDLSYSYHKSYLDSKTPSNQFKSSTSGDVDLAVTHLKAWYSPFPPPDDDICKYYCFVYETANIGDAYSGDPVWVNISVYLVYGDEEERLMSVYGEKSDIPVTQIDTSSVFWCIPIDHYIDKIKVEVVTTAPDSNPKNNVKEVELGEGITIWGRVYTQNLFGGNKQPAILALMSLDSEYDEDGPILTGRKWAFGTYQVIEQEPPCRHDWFTQVSPKNPDKPKYEYKLSAQISLLQRQTKHTDGLVGMDYREIFFTFLNLDSQSIPQSSSSPSSTTQQSFASTATTFASTPTATATTTTTIAATSKSSLPASR